MNYQPTGSCPRCGAPIFAYTSGLPGTPGGMTASTQEEAPKAHFTCDCRQFLPYVPSGEIEQPRSVSQGDAKFVVDEREAERERRRRGGV